MTIGLPSILLSNQENNIEDYWNTCPKMIRPSENNKKQTPNEILMESKDRKIKDQQAIIDNLRANIRIANAKISNFADEKKQIEESHEKTISDLKFEIFKLRTRTDDVIRVDVTGTYKVRIELSNAQELIAKQEKELRESKTIINELTDTVEELKAKSNMLAQMCSSHYRFLEEKKEEIKRIHDSYQSNFGKTDGYELKFRNQEAALNTMFKALANKHFEVERLQKKVNDGQKELRGAEEALLFEIKTACKREKDLQEKINELEKMLELEEVELAPITTQEISVEEAKKFYLSLEEACDPYC